MLRFTPIANATQAETYYSKSDGGYYDQSAGLHREWGGKGARLLGLSGPPDYAQFKRLIHGLDPRTGEQLTAKLIEERIPGWDVTASVPKGVTTALERGDWRIRQAMWEAGREAMTDLERMATTRVRKDGRQEDRLTQNILYYAKEDAETRPNKEDRMPDWDRHIHFVLMNATFDPVEKEWKALKFRPIMDLRKWFSHRFDLRLSHKLAELGYEIETKLRADGRGGKRYHTWDIKGIPQSVITKFSRRSAEVEALVPIAEAAIKREHGEEAQLGPVGKDKLGATSRLSKRDDLTPEDYRAYWNDRITPEEGRAIAETIRRARERRNPKPANTAEKGVAYAIAHEFERNSVVSQKQLEITAMERCMGGARPEDFEPQLQKQGVLLVDGKATTGEMVARERRLENFAVRGRGRYRPLGDPERPCRREWLNAGQKAAVRHVLSSRDFVTIIRGVYGTGKTTMEQEIGEALAETGKPVVALAPTAAASDVLREEAKLPAADTVARFLVDPKMQERARWGVVLVDEAGMLSTADMLRLFTTAERVRARVVLVGDRKQTRSVAAGEPLRLLEQRAGLPVAEVTEIMRQTGGYKQAAKALSQGKVAEAVAMLDGLGWVKEVPDEQRYRMLADAYLAATREKKRGGEFKTALAVSPTWAEAARITAAVRMALREEGRLRDERLLTTWVPAHLTEPQKADAANYEPGDLLVFHRPVPGYRCGDRVTVAAGQALPLQYAKHFEVYRPVQLGVAVGDRLRVTRNGVSKDGRHKLRNGTLFTVQGFTPQGDVVVDKGWVIPATNGGHIALGYAVSAETSQGRTVDKVLVGLSSQSFAAANQRRFGVPVTRGKEQVLIFTDDKAGLLKAVQRPDEPLSAVELFEAGQRQRLPLIQRLGKHLAYLRRLAGFNRLHERRPAARSQAPTRNRGIDYDYGR
jgi:conjugative relaxase-like TrwC/TraI family protein